MAYRLVPTQEPIPALGTNPSDEDMQRYLVDENRALHDWYKTYQEAVNRALNLPSFRVHRNGTDQTGLVTATPTKLALNSVTGEGWDSHTYFDRTTNYRFTPKIPGVYRMLLSVRFNYSAAANVEEQALIYLNGAAIAAGYAYHLNGSNAPTIIAETDVRLNGRTDYVEFYAQQSSGVNKDVLGTATVTFACGHKVSDLPT